MCLLPTGDTPDKSALEMKAEAWRAKPGFEREEVTITRLGEFSMVVQSSCKEGSIEIEVKT